MDGVGMVKTDFVGMGNEGAGKWLFFIRLSFCKDQLGVKKADRSTFAPQLPVLLIGFLYFYIHNQQAHFFRSTYCFV